MPVQPPKHRRLASSGCAGLRRPSLPRSTRTQPPQSQGTCPKSNPSGIKSVRHQSAYPRVPASQLVTAGPAFPALLPDPDDSGGSCRRPAEQPAMIMISIARISIPVKITLSRYVKPVNRCVSIRIPILLGSLVSKVKLPPGCEQPPSLTLPTPPKGAAAGQPRAVDWAGVDCRTLRTVADCGNRTLSAVPAVAPAVPSRAREGTRFPENARYRRCCSACCRSS